MRKSFLFLALLFGCGGGDSTGPNAVPKLGRYEYEMSIPSRAGVRTEARYSGTMILTYATADSIAGQWDVPTAFYPAFNRTDVGYRPEMMLGFKNAGAYVVYASPIDGGTITHRLTLNGTGFACEGAYLYTSSAGVGTVPGACSVQYVGP